MAEFSVCYTTDAGYLFPSFASAVDVRRRLAADTDVTIFGFDLDGRTVEAFGPACADAGIELVTLTRRAIDGAPAMLARMFLADLLPTTVRTFLYIDGDTQFRGSLDPLRRCSVEPGQFLAVSDPMTFAVPGTDRLARDVAGHFRALGFAPDEAARYFNSGVILADREGWGPIGHEAWRLFTAQASPSRFPDQDVINLAGRGRHLPLSLAWNFPIYMMNARVADVVRPRIVHYMSNPKPWQGVFPPWTRAEYRPYDALVRRYPAIAPSRDVMSIRQRARYHLQQRYKRLLEPLSWGVGERQDRILDYERRLAVLRPSEFDAGSDPDDDARARADGHGPLAAASAGIA